MPLPTGKLEHRLLPDIDTAPVLAAARRCSPLMYIEMQYSTVHGTVCSVQYNVQCGMMALHATTTTISCCHDDDDDDVGQPRDR